MYLLLAYLEANHSFYLAGSSWQVLQLTQNVFLLTSWTTEPFSKALLWCRWTKGKKRPPLSDCRHLHVHTLLQHIWLCQFLFFQSVMDKAYMSIVQIYVKHLIKANKSNLEKCWNPHVSDTVRDDAQELHSTMSELVRSTSQFFVSHIYLHTRLTCTFCLRPPEFNSRTSYCWRSRSYRTASVSRHWR